MFAEVRNGFLYPTVLLNCVSRYCIGKKQVHKTAALTVEIQPGLSCSSQAKSGYLEKIFSL